MTGQVIAGHWDFVLAAYGVTLLGTAAIVAHSLMRMRGAERRAAALLEDR